MHDRDRRNPPVQKRRWPAADTKGRDSEAWQTSGKSSGDDNKDRTVVAKGSSEMELKNIKCFGCHQKGHVISDCPEKKAKKSRRVIQTEQTIVNSAETKDVDPWDQSVATSQPESSDNQLTNGPRESWMRVLTAATEEESGDSQSAKLVGPAFKVNVDIEGVKTRALLDNGSQVTLVRGEHMARVRAQNNWTLEQCHEKNRPMDTQPIGASGQELGATSDVAIDKTGSHKAECNNSMFCGYI